MAVNGIEIEVGQKWRTRNGTVVIVHNKDAHPVYPFDLLYAIDARSATSVTQTGAQRFDGVASDFDLVELVMPAVKTPKHMVPWAGGEQPAETKGCMVEALWRNATNGDIAPADDIRWAHEGLADDIVAYRVLGQAVTTRGSALPTAPGLLDKAAAHMRERAATYDSPQGERSMAKTVALFNLHHGTALTEAQGWHFMQILKGTRLVSAKGYHADCAEDGIVTEPSALAVQIGGSHYKDLAIQPIQYIHANKLGFCESNVVKYITRHAAKNGADDIRKGIHYCQLLLELQYGVKKEGV